MTSKQETMAKTTLENVHANDSRNPKLDSVENRRKALAQYYPSWKPMMLHTMFDGLASRFSQRPYVITHEKEYSYGEIRELSIKIAQGLGAIGVRQGDHVAVLMANYPEFVALKYAISRLGATSVPVNFLYRKDELGYVLDQSDASVLVTMDSFRGLDHLSSLDALYPGWDSDSGLEENVKLRRVVVFPTGQQQPRNDVFTLTDLIAAGKSNESLDIETDVHSPADLIYTSGTTGKPKGVILTHDMLTRTAYAGAYARAYENGRRVHFSLPMYHVYGYVEGMLATAFVGGAIIPHLNFDARATLETIERYKATDALLIPTMTLSILDILEKESSYDLSSLTSVISSGGFSPKWIWAKIEQLLKPQEITVGYGMSETTASTTVTDPDGPLEKLQNTNGKLRDAGIAGTAELNGRLVVYKVIDPSTGEELPVGEVGELICRGPGITPGYYNKPEETAAAIDSEGWLHTGDVGSIDSQGFLTLVGRTKEIYRCGGEQVVPKEVEDELRNHPSVSEAHVVAIPDDRMGEVGVAWIVARKGKPFDEESLREYCTSRLAKFKVPKYFIAVDESQIPLTPSGRPRKFLMSQRSLELLNL